MRRTIAVAALLVVGCASGPPPAPEPPPPPPPAPAPAPPPLPPALCVADRVASGPVDPTVWTSLLLRGYDPATRRATWPALDCTGAQVRWDGPVLACDDPAAARTPVADQPIVGEDVVASPAGPDRWLVWIAVHRFASGDALGPVALVRRTGSELRVEALGALRAYPWRARLRLDQLGAQQVLLADGELCRAGDPARCTRAARVVPLVRDRFVPTPVLAPNGSCLSPAWFDLARTERRQVGRSWERLDMGGSLGASGNGLAVEEEVVVQDLGPNPDGQPRRLVHRAHATRLVRWEKGGFVSDEAPLWSRLRPSPPR